MRITARVRLRMGLALRLGLKVSLRAELTVKEPARLTTTYHKKCVKDNATAPYVGRPSIILLTLTNTNHIYIINCPWAVATQLA